MVKDVSETETGVGSYWMTPDRISLLTDGVVAIAITLMVLELHIPDLEKHPNGLWEMGGEFFVNSEVVKLLIEDGKATGVRLKNGTEVGARELVVSDLSAFQTICQLIGEDY